MTGERFLTDSVGFFIVLDCASLVCSMQKGNISQIHKKTFNIFLKISLKFLIPMP